MAVSNHTKTESEEVLDNVIEQSAPDTYRQPAELVVREIIETLLLTFFIFWLVHSLIGRYRIDGSSMNPTLLDGEYRFRPVATTTMSILTQATTSKVFWWVCNYHNHAKQCYKYGKQVKSAMSDVKKNANLLVEYDIGYG